MQIIKTDFVTGAREAQGIVVIIDVFRAFSVACYCFSQGAKNIIATGDIDTALTLKKSFPHAILIGERSGKKVSGFDHGNSPSQLQGIALQGKTIIHTTHAGTQGLVNAHQATEILTGAFVNAKAIAKYITKKKPQTVTLVRMGWKGETLTEEDTLCADYLESLLTETEFNDAQIVDNLRSAPCAERFFDPLQPWNPVDDFYMCLEINRFNFAITAHRGVDNHISLQKIVTSG